MRYDVILNDAGHDALSVALAVANSMQQLVPQVALNVQDARRWVDHTPMILRRGISHQVARDMQRAYRKLGAEVAVKPSQLLLPREANDISEWQNEWFSEHLIALHESALRDWAQVARVDEGYRFSFLPSLGADMMIRMWSAGETLHATARYSIGQIGPMPGPPEHEINWSPTPNEWQNLRTLLTNHRFWDSDSWNTVPEGYIVLDSIHWVIEGWRNGRYHVLVDQTPNDGAAREVGLLLMALLPDTFAKPDI